MSNKTTSCGVIITNGINILGCLPTGRKFSERNAMDLPKGHKEVGETNLEAALRELKEETGLSPKASDLVELGTFKYRPTKDLVLFMWYTNELPNLNTLHCEATFEDDRGNTIHEHSGFEYINRNDVEKRFFSTLGSIIKEVMGW